jgi:hypothetical protein
MALRIDTKIKRESTHLYNELFLRMGVHRPNLSFIFIENARLVDMIIPVASDFPGVVLMFKNTPHKSEKKSFYPNFYCIALKYVSFVHYNSGLVIDDSIYDLYDIDPNYVLFFCDFVHNNQIVNMLLFPREERHLLICYSKITRNQINPTISDFIRQDVQPHAHLELGYYIKSQSYDFIHCFKKSSKNIKSDALRLIDYRNPNAFDQIMSTEIGSIYNLISNNTTVQNKQLEISQLVSSCAMEIFFTINI